MSLYSQMHAEVHTRGRLRVLCVAGREAVGLAWVTGEFEFFCVAGPNTAREALLSGANGVVGWVNRERERLFIVGGAVF